MDDGKIRLRCTGCGKRVKFPAGAPGETYRCPICHTVIVAPLDAGAIERPGSAELFSAVSKPEFRPRRPRPVSKPEPRPQPANGPALKAIQRPPADDATQHPVEVLSNFMILQTRRASKISREVLGNALLSLDEKKAKLRKLRQLKAIGLREQVLRIRKDLDRRIGALHNTPNANTPAMQKKINKFECEREELKLYLDIMFELRAPSQEQAPSQPPTDDTPDTPGSAEAPCTTS